MESTAETFVVPAAKTELVELFGSLLVTALQVATWLAVVVESAAVLVAVAGFESVHIAAVEVEYYAAAVVVGKLTGQFAGKHHLAGSGDVIMAH